VTSEVIRALPDADHRNPTDRQCLDHPAEVLGRLLGATEPDGIGYPDSGPVHRQQPNHRRQRTVVQQPTRGQPG
jgi:hypothetical protein